MASSSPDENSTNDFDFSKRYLRDQRLLHLYSQALSSAVFLPSKGSPRSQAVETT